VTSFPFSFILALLLLAGMVIVGVGLLRLLFAGASVVFSGVSSLFAHVFGCLGGIAVDLARSVAAVVTAVFLMPLLILNLVTGRRAASEHYGQAVGAELEQALISVYRASIGYPLRLIGLGQVATGLERRIPEIIAHAPGPDLGRGGAASFSGYRIVGTLPAGGSGARLYLAEPDEAKREKLARSGLPTPDQVVIKAFSLEAGSTMPQIVRESRALEAARNIGLVLEHELAASRFHYVMPYVPGVDLGQTTREMHAAADSDGLDEVQLRTAVGYGVGLLSTLSRFHRAGLWHKDIKPNNLIVNDGQVELVDLGLVTPLASAMTLTTHGTEYYRDPELVRQAMQGVRVQDVDGVKFDLYSAGAVLFNLIENEFPAHGGLSRITRRCPDALRWIIRRAMADQRSRYESADEMLADLRVLEAADDPFAVKPAQLPSMGGAPAPAGLHRSSPSHGPGARPAAARVSARTRAGASPTDSKRSTLKSGNPVRWLVAALAMFFLLPAALIALLLSTIFGSSSVTYIDEVSVPAVLTSSHEGAGYALKGMHTSGRPFARQIEAGLIRMPEEPDMERGPDPRVLFLPSGPGALARSERQEFESRLASDLGWTVLSDVTETDPGAGRGDELELLSKAHLIISQSALGDPVVSEALRSQVLDQHDFDAVMRYEWVGPDEALNFEFIAAEGREALLSDLLELEAGQLDQW
jgi:serine/threonine protein kinase